MKRNKNTIVWLLIASILFSIAMPISLIANANGTTEAAGTLRFHLQAVNLLSGATTISANSELTVQYTDASLGDNLEMYAQITTTDGTILVDKQQIGSGFLRVENRNLFVDNENTSVNKNIYSNTAGSVTFAPALSGSYAVSDLQVTVWIENSTNAGVYSNKATAAINHNFTAGTPSGLTANNWMNYIDGATLLTQINMPGTHDSGAQYFSSLSTYNKCQDVDIATQLSYGVRYLDMRADMINLTESNTVNNTTVTNFGISHGSYPAKKGSTSGPQLTFKDVYDWCKAFLTANPSECIVMTIQDDNCNSRGDLMAAVLSFVKADPAMFYTKSNEIPVLDDVRGKIVVLRKFPGDYAGDNGGMDFFWQDNSNGTEHPVIPVSNGNAVTTYVVQDYYNQTRTNKATCAINFLSTAANNKKANQFYINFFSGTRNTTTILPGSPMTIAEYVNGQFSNQTLTKGASYGYLIFDDITAAICEKVYTTNIFTATAQSTTANNEVSNEKVVHYDFSNVGNNTVADLENNGFDGTMNNASLLTVNSIYDIITFNNTGVAGDSAGYISIPQSVFRGTGDTVTMQVWIKDTGNNGRDTWLSIGRNVGGVGNNYFVANTKWDGNGPRYAIKSTKVQGGGIEIANFGAANTNNTWHLLTYVINGDNFKIYVDGNTTAAVDGKTNANFSDMDPGVFVDCAVRLGAASYWLGDDSFIGSIGDFTIYNYAVTPAEIAATYAALANEYTYILEAGLGSSVAVASTTASSNYIDEKYTDTGNVIYLTAPSGYDLTSATLSLQYDGSQVEISTDDGSTYSAFSAGGPVDLSGGAILKVTSLDGTRVKYYTVVVTA